MSAAWWILLILMTTGIVGMVAVRAVANARWRRVTDWQHQQLADRHARALADLAELDADVGAFLAALNEPASDERERVLDYRRRVADISLCPCNTRRDPTHNNSPNSPIGAVRRRFPHQEEDVEQDVPSLGCSQDETQQHHGGRVSPEAAEARPEGGKE